MQGARKGANGGRRAREGRGKGARGMPTHTRRYAPCSMILPPGPVHMSSDAPGRTRVPASSSSRVASASRGGCSIPYSSSSAPSAES
eukprot:323697-Chlamydomonas_euryale.AAC.1